jgi:hypothetical protein
MCFDGADSAKQLINDRRSQRDLSEPEIRDLTMVNLTAHEVASGEARFVDKEFCR